MAIRKRSQFTISAILILMVLSALAVVIWQKFIYVHPAHRNALYEKAPFTNNGKFTINGNTLRLHSIARSDRDGQLTVEDGFGKASTLKVPYDDLLKSSGSWLDTAQIELKCSTPMDGGRLPVEVLQIRVFDFATRQLLWEMDAQSGSRMIDPKTLHIYRLGGKLPDLVDVWLRVKSYPKADAEIVKLKPKPGATVDGFAGNFEITEMVRGFKSHAGGVLTGSEANAHRRTAFLVEYHGSWPKDQRVQVTAVSEDGERRHLSQFYRFSQNEKTRLLILPFAAHELDYIEIQPFVDIGVFFYQGVRLPTTSTMAFATPPQDLVNIAEADEHVPLSAYLPLDVSLRWIEGRVSGSSADSHGVSFMNVIQDDSASIVVQTNGIKRPPFRTSIAGSPRRSGSGEASSGPRSLKYEVIQSPDNEIESIGINMPSPDPGRLVFPN